MDIWKWLAGAAAVYCILAVWTAGQPVGNRQGGPGHGFQPQQVPAGYDFEQPAPPFHTRPKTHAEVVRESNGNHILRWEYILDKPHVYALVFPIHPGETAHTLRLDIRADFEGEIRVGVGERDGSMYFSPVIVSHEWRELRLPLEEMELPQIDENENSTLDLQQVQHAGIVDIHLGAATRKGQLVTMEIDNVRFE